MKLLILLSGLFIFTNCVSLAPREERSISTIFETGVKKGDAYQRALIYLAKSLNNGNLAIQVRDESQGRIVSLAQIKCNSYKRWKYPMNQVWVDFNIDFTAKDQKARIIFDDIVLGLFDPYGRKGAFQEPLDKEDTDSIDKECLEPIRAEIIRSVKGQVTIAPSQDF
ncbi:DUF4468 domain-containing protein [Leptospira gomenensis]|uniref:DUF4468 domain-containing protein n=1 Tax=Leptospira gomenensis TaxID=2484974 RepID=A0A5F1YDJ5_9LEPT|nr:DUF4468 domain-containing protein [Leptospira gomenensis]TGK36203.1 DUF4468 domain-containing protein [Leptospira gomenensis]TGK42759.1 DUF4468 domain-containing protein [Leptospira gomenensis]TGK42947.1 DUF4468 domain-containing protein [Leptospira gomenensis]TGK54958.1 DUF4468 domain-containing protein [Leptospira gomenensis]